jgi:anthranilate synthase/aminodeoxychorismate synthase-like glutamine amidotransferase
MSTALHAPIQVTITVPVTTMTMTTTTTTVTTMATLLVIDNYDSFTWNLVHAIGQRAPTLEVRVARNDELDASALGAQELDALVISPGPCSPAESGICRDAIRALAGRVPILGVCLGHQSIADAYGMRVVHAPEPVHGKTSAIEHDGRGLFDGLPSPMTVARYHSLVVDRSTVCGPFEVSAWTPDGLVMGLRWTGAGSDRCPMDGVQFHPESFMTGEGPAILGNFLRTVG